MDILLLVGETCICISSLIAYNVESTIRSEAQENTPLLTVTTNANTTLNETASSFLVQQQEPLANATLNGTASSFLVQQQESLAKYIAKHYPVANAMIVIFDILGLIIFLSGFLYFFKDICGRVCVDENKKKRSQIEPK